MHPTTMTRSYMSRPVAPTTNLPPLSRLVSYSTEQIEQALLNLYAIYRPQAFPSLSGAATKLPKHLIHDVSVPDSGYASAEDEDEDEMSEDEGNCSDASDDDLDILRSDALERDHAVRWLTAFTARSDTWMYDPALADDVEADARAQLVDNAAALLASFAGEDGEEALTRTFTFTRGEGAEGEINGTVEVELNDAALLTEDHTSVGLQSWGSSIILAEQFCATPAAFGFSEVEDRLRILELGAGTGLLSITAAKLLRDTKTEIVATDYHPSVLDNLKDNVITNFPLHTSTSPSTCPVSIMPLDWQNPAYNSPLDVPFDIIVAADVVYHPDHARWIKGCVEHLLARPSPQTAGDGHAKTRLGGVFWLIIPLRTTGRHAGMNRTVDAIFPRASRSMNTGRDFDDTTMQLAILSARQMGKLGGVGRADEGGYTLYEIGWAPAACLELSSSSDVSDSIY